MIFDNIKNKDLYVKAHPLFEKAFGFIEEYLKILLLQLRNILIFQYGKYMQPQKGIVICLIAVTLTRWSYRNLIPLVFNRI